MDTTNKKAEIARLFFEMNRVMKHSMRKSFENSGLTLPQGMVIHTLIQHGEMKITELSKRTNLSNSTISGIVDRLEKQQLVIRTRSEEDRRIVYVKVTPKIKEIFQGVHKQAEENLTELLSLGTFEDFEKIIEGLNILKKLLTDKLADDRN